MRTSPDFRLSTSVQETFLRIFGGTPRVFRAPGRVNLIGEHTDYNDGLVMPAAIGFHTYAAITARSDRTLAVHSVNYGETCELQLDAQPRDAEHHWTDYILGVARVLESLGHRISGANLVIHGNIPVGAGLSSSASVEVATALALLDVSGVSLEPMEIARACQQAEHEYAGTKCGIMDQFICCFGQADCALMLDCRTLQYDAVRIDPSVRIVVCNTMVKHQLAYGQYNRRRADCEEGVRYLRKHLAGISALRDVTTSVLEQYGADMPDVTYRRCRHVISENERVLDAEEALQRGDTLSFGLLMAESHRSLRDDYEVSCPELDLMVELADKCRGVYGARMTGGGFGGCTVNFVRAEAAEKFKQTIEREYERATRMKPEVYICNAAAGASEFVAV